MKGRSPLFFESNQDARKTRYNRSKSAGANLERRPLLTNGNHFGDRGRSVSERFTDAVELTSLKAKIVRRNTRNSLSKVRVFSKDEVEKKQDAYKPVKPGM